jgi:uncharacterized protein YbjT (DUF2867 family)
MERIILVTGATGKQGGAVAHHLLEQGWKVRALTRSPEKDAAVALQKKGVEIMKGDLDDPELLREALNNTYGVFSVQNSWEHGVEKERIQGKTLADEAKRAGVSHFIYSSVGSAHRATAIPHFESKWDVEQHVRSTGLRFTILRPVFFMENFLAPDTLSAIRSGNLPLGVDPAKSLQMIAVDDIGTFAALAFKTTSEYANKEIDIAGDELTGPQMAGILGKVLERDIVYRQTPIEQIRAFSEDYARMIEWFNVKGYNADIPALRKIHPALMTFERWVREHISVISMEYANA